MIKHVNGLPAVATVLSTTICFQLMKYSMILIPKSFFLEISWNG